MTQQEQVRVNPLNGKPLRRRGYGPVRAVLTKNATATQAALDEYLATVANPCILVPLRAARDSARDALAAFDRQQGVAKP